MQVAAIFTRQQAQPAVFDPHLFVRRDHIDVTGLHPHTIPGLADLQGGFARKQGREGALVHGVQMLHENQTQTRALRQMFQQLCDGFQAACRGANASDGKH